jgi:hypothetical protein
MAVSPAISWRLWYFLWGPVYLAGMLDTSDVRYICDYHAYRVLKAPIECSKSFIV